MESLAKSWDELVRHVCQNPQSPPFVIEKRGGAIKLTREWNLQHLDYVWTKESKGNLSFLCGWERDLLHRIDDSGVRKRVLFVNIHSEGSRSRFDPKGKATA